MISCTFTIKVAEHVIGGGKKKNNERKEYLVIPPGLVEKHDVLSFKFSKCLKTTRTDPKENKEVGIMFWFRRLTACSWTGFCRVLEE